MRKALAARYLEHLTGDDLIDLDELIGADDDEDFISASLQNAIQEISSGGSTAGKQMRALKAHAQDSAQPYGHHSMTKNLLLRCGYFGRDDVSMAIKLSRAFVAFKAWMSANKVECSQPPFTEKMLFKKNSDILLTSKAYNGRVVVQWLSHEVHLASTSPTFSAYDPRFFVIVAALRRMARFLCGLERAGRYLKQPSFLSWLRRRGRDGMDQEHLFEGPPYSCHPLDHAVWKAQDLGISFEDQKV
ncbi:Telomerase Cajal body protein 1 [Durusdinium trenchii]|uniref:Telomerase Cajal body protein 1 n=1 Tax=Durusdinium trenchii TaxID=1381693 RepID=A0ABP0KZM0_9DINO